MPCGVMWCRRCPPLSASTPASLLALDRREAISPGSCFSSEENIMLSLHMFFRVAVCTHGGGSFYPFSLLNQERRRRGPRRRAVPLSRKAANFPRAEPLEAPTFLRWRGNLRATLGAETWGSDLSSEDGFWTRGSPDLIIHTVDMIQASTSNFACLFCLAAWKGTNLTLHNKSRGNTAARQTPAGALQKGAVRPLQPPCSSQS